MRLQSSSFNHANIIVQKTAVVSAFWWFLFWTTFKSSTLLKIQIHRVLCMGHGPNSNGWCYLLIGELLHVQLELSIKFNFQNLFHLRWAAPIAVWEMRLSKLMIVKCKKEMARVTWLMRLSKGIFENKVSFLNEHTLKKSLRKPFQIPLF